MNGQKNTKVYFAPLEGITDAVFRCTFHACFGGMDKYFMPFISPSHTASYTMREEFDLSLAQNSGLYAVPQILAKNAEYFLTAARCLRDQGYPEVNLNLGCPSGTVTGKGKGAAMLRDLDSLQYFLDAIYICPPLPLSIKCRIGYETREEWERILPVLARYPVSELIVHPRTCIQQYRGETDRGAFGEAVSQMPCPVIYNGDLCLAEDCESLLQENPNTGGLMLGRGLIANPALIRQLRGGAALNKEDLASFHDQLLRAYLVYWPQGAAVGKMHVFLKYFCSYLDVSGKDFRAAMKANTLSAYQDAVGELFAHSAFCEEARFFWRDRL